MFVQKKPKMVQRDKPRPPYVPEILRPQIYPGYYGHMGREPNSNYHVQLFNYKKYQAGLEFDQMNEESERLMKEKIYAQCARHTDKKVFESKVRNKVEEKLRKFDEDVIRRREKLRDLLCREDKAYYAEVIDHVQKAEAFKLEELKQHNAEVKAKREAERLKIVEEKRFQLFKENCPEFRPAVFKYNLIESKNCQLAQIREKEELKEADRELDRMWHQLLLKELRAKEKREKQELLKRRQTQQELLDVWDKQIRGKAKLKQEEERIAAENKEEMKKLLDRVEKEYIESVEADRKKKEETARLLKEQMELRRRVLERLKREEDAIDHAFSRLNKAEIEKEKQGIVNTTMFAKRESATYRESLRFLEQQKKEEERRFDELLEEHRKAVEAQQDAARCQYYLAKRKLQKDVVAEVAKQLEYKRREAENKLKLQQAENELLRIDCEIYERNRQEAAILEEQATELYREDLKAQIEANRIRREKEAKELKQELQHGLENERKYKEIVEALIRQSSKVPCTHPFAKVLETKGACPPVINK